MRETYSIITYLGMQMAKAAAGREEDNASLGTETDISLNRRQVQLDVPLLSALIGFWLNPA